MCNIQVTDTCVYRPLYRGFMIWHMECDGHDVVVISSQRGGAVVTPRGGVSGLTQEKSITHLNVRNMAMHGLNLSA